MTMGANATRYSDVRYYIAAALKRLQGSHLSV